MPLVPKWRRYLRFWRADVQGDVDDELRFHFEARAEALRARGATPEEVARIVAEEFGDVEATRRRLQAIGERVERRRARLRWWHRLRADLAYALRGLRATPAFTLGVVLTLAVGIGGAATMYGTMRRLLVLAPPHVAAPATVAKLLFHYEPAGDSAIANDRLSYPFLERVRARTRTLAALAAYEPDLELAVGRGDAATLARATLVSPGFWRTLGTRPALGRLIADEETHPATGARVVVLGHAFWRRWYGGDPAAIGTTLHVKGLPYRVVGVAPRGFRGVELGDTDVWLPLLARTDGSARPTAWHASLGANYLSFVARLRPGLAAAAPAELTAERLRLAEEERGARARAPRSMPHMRVSLAPLTGALGRDGRRLPEATVAVWLAGVAFVLLAVACANVACLLLLRALRRRREIAVRMALGMSRGRLVALLFAESAVLAALGGLAAVAVAVGGGAWVRRTLLPGMLGDVAGRDWRTLGIAAACVAGVALLTGLAPVLHTRGDPTAGLRDSAQRGAARRSALHAGLIVAQTALSALLLVGAGLFLRSLHRVGTTDLGLDTRHVQLVSIDFTGTGRDRQAVAAFFERALERVRVVPGVADASLATGAPLRSAAAMFVSTTPGGEWVGRRPPMYSDVADGFLAATGMRVAQGRDFVAADRHGPPVVIVNEALAAAAWPGRSPVGQCAYLSSAPTACARVVGVAGNARTFALREEQRPWVYVPLRPAAADRRVLLVRAAPGARALDGTLRRVLRELDPALPYVRVEPLGDALDPQIRPWRLGATAFTAFGALAALLAALGLYTAVAYAVAQRTREIGIRIAVGARHAAVARLVLGDGLRVTALGVALGLALALLAGRRLAPLLFDTSPRDAVVFTAVGSTLIAVALLATLGPARRAARVSPTEALRAE